MPYIDDINTYIQMTMRIVFSLENRFCCHVIPSRKVRWWMWWGLHIWMTYEGPICQGRSTTMGRLISGVCRKQWSKSLFKIALILLFCSRTLINHVCKSTISYDFFLLYCRQWEKSRLEENKLPLCETGHWEAAVPEIASLPRSH